MAIYVSQPKKLDSRHNRHWLIQDKRIQCCVCCTKNKEKEQNAGVKNAILGCVLPHVLRYITPICMLENQPTLKRESRRHNCQQILTLPLLNWYFSVASFWWNNGAEGDVDFIEGALWTNRDLSEGTLCACSCSTLPIWRKNKNHCLETSVNNLWLLEKSKGCY